MVLCAIAAQKSRNQFIIGIKNRKKINKLIEIDSIKISITDEKEYSKNSKLQKRR